MDKAPTGTGPLILFIDDNPVDRALIMNILPKFGFRVITAETGNDGLIMAEAKKPDLVLLDIILPRMSGVEVCKRLKANPATQNIPVIFFSGIELPKKFINFQEVGAVDFLSKTQTGALIADRINQVLNSATPNAIPASETEHS